MNNNNVIENFIHRAKKRPRRKRNIEELVKDKEAKFRELERKLSIGEKV